MAQLLTLRDIALQCQAAFKDCLAYEALDEVGIRSAQGNFNLWCAELKVTSQDDRATLDYRLRKKGEILNVIRNVLRALLGALANCQRLCDAIPEAEDEDEDEEEFPDEKHDSHDDFEGDGLEETTQEGDFHGQPNSISRNGIPDEIEYRRSNPSSDRDEIRTSALDEQLRYIRIMIDQLTWTSLTLRQSGNNYRFEEADTEFDEGSFNDFRRHLTAMILRAFEDSDSKHLTSCEKAERVTDYKRLNTVQKRLVRANLLRRNRIQCATNSRFPKPAALVINTIEREVTTPKQWQGSRISPSSISRTQDTTTSDSPRVTLPVSGEIDSSLHLAKTATDVDSQLTAKDILPKGPSSTATRMTKITAKQEYPRQPAPLEDGSLRCPYCDKLLPADFASPGHKSSWTNHIVYDIVPYQCIVEDCHSAEEMYLTSQALRNHMLAEHSEERWTCYHCKESDQDEGNSIPMFATASDWQTHISITHAEIIPVEHRATFAKINKVVVIGPLKCPLCSFETQRPDTDIDDHILQHLHAFALQSLTDGIPGGSEDESKASQVSQLTITSNHSVAGDRRILTYPTLQSEEVREMVNQHWTTLDSTHRSTSLPTIYKPPIDPAVRELWNVEAQVLMAVLYHASSSARVDFVGDLTQQSAADATKDLLKLRNTALEVIAQMNSIAARPAPSIVAAPERNKAFVDHGNHLAQIDRSRRMLGSQAALVGLGGIGKTSLALEYAYRVYQELPRPWVFWVNATTNAQFKRSFQEIAAYVQIRGRHDTDADIFELVRDWLLGGTSGPWVLILDNVDDIELFERFDAIPLMSDLRDSLRGFILVTTRSLNAASELVGSTNYIFIKEMGEADALRLLGQSLQRPFIREDAVELVNISERLPLAITMAGNYISQLSSEYSIREYLDLYRIHAASSHFDVDATPSFAPSFQTIWQLTFSDIQLTKPSALEPLFLMSFCDPRNIPEFLLRYQGQSSQPAIKEALHKRRDGGDHLPLKIQTNTVEAYWLKAGLKENTATLLQYALIRGEEDGTSFAMPRLVQMATLQWLEKNGQKEQWRHRFLKNLDAALPPLDYRNLAEWKILFPHVLSAATEPPEELESLKVWATVLYRTALFTLQAGDYTETVRLSEMAMKARAGLFGEDHEDTLQATQRVARAYYHVGRYLEAEAHLMRVMEPWQLGLDSDHPDSLTSMEYLASIYRISGKPSMAESLEKRILESQQVKLGLDHPDTLTTMERLASTYRAQGKLLLADSLEKRILGYRQVRLGPDHPYTLSTMEQLASTYRAQGRTDEAETLEISVWRSRRKLLGPNHPNTLSSMEHLASMYRAQGRIFEEEKAMK